MNTKEENLISVEKPKKYIFKQVLACSSAFAAAMALGAQGGFPAVTIPQLQNDTSDPLYLTDEQVSWFASLPTFATIPTCVVGGLMGQAFGRRLSLLLVAPIFAVSFILQAIASEVAMFQFGRFLSGIAGGLVSGPASTYVSEISDPDWRTTLCAGMGLMYIVGTLSIYTLGAICHWRLLAGLSAIFPALSFICGLFSPESPPWLITKGRLYEAKMALCWLQSSGTFFCTKGPERRDDRVRVNLENRIDAEIQTILVSYQRKISNEKVGYWMRYASLFYRKDVWKPLIIIFVMFLMQQFSGLTTITYYAVDVLSDSHSSVNEYLGTIIFGITRLAAHFLGSFMLLRFKRKHLFISSALITGIGMTCLGFTNSQFFASIENENLKEFLGALPLISILIATIGYQFGISPITWSYAAELFPLDARAELTGISNCFGNLSIFLVVKTFPTLFGLLGNQVYWLYASVCLCNMLFGILILPETKGKHLEEINKEFEDDRNERDELVEKEAGKVA